MKPFYFQKHRVAGLAALCGMSESHFTRLFRAAFGTTPIDWLRRERISQAKRRLAETRDAIKEIATQVGYGDHYFSARTSNNSWTRHRASIAAAKRHVSERRTDFQSVSAPIPDACEQRPAWPHASLSAENTQPPARKAQIYS
jgi:AraC-like DNA-binding protein